MTNAPRPRQAGCFDLFKFQLAVLVPLFLLLLHPGRSFAARPPLTVFRVVFAVGGGVVALLVNYWILFITARIVAERDKRGARTNIGLVATLDTLASLVATAAIYLVFALKLRLWH